MRLVRKSVEAYCTATSGLRTGFAPLLTARTVVASVILALVTAVAFCLGGCSSLGNSSKSAYIETHLVGTWSSDLGAKTVFESDGSYVSPTGTHGKWRVDYPFLDLDRGDGWEHSSITSYDFSSEPETISVDISGIKATMTRLDAHPSSDNSSEVSKKAGTPKSCPICYGSGKCTKCQGTGQMNCFYCGGTGVFGESRCTTCSGTGHVMCIMCQGSGRCPACGGTGRVVEK